MTLLTDSPRVVNHRKNIVRLMIAEHPESCIVCSKGNRCELRRIAANLGVGDPNLYPMPNYKPFETLNPFIVRDLSKCILCGKCIRADHELVCVGAIDYNDRGFASRPATLLEAPLENSRCTFCGTCVSMCPTGALSVKHSGFVGTPEREALSICGFCGAGCSLTLGVSGNRVVEVNPASGEQSVNGPTLCVRGHFAHDFLNAPDRLTQPLVRADGNGEDAALKPSSWDEALSIVGGRLAEIKREYGPESIGFIGSGKCTNEENYLLQKIARAVFETNNITTCGAISGQSLLRRVEDKTMGASRVSPLADLETAEAILVIHADCEHTVPVAGYHIKQAAKKGTPLVIIDSRRTDLAPFGHWLRPETISGAADMLNALALQILNASQHDPVFMDRYTEGAESFTERLQSNRRHVPAGQELSLENAAALLGGRKIAILLGPDLLEYEHGEAVFDAACNLGLITGSIGAKSAGFFIPTLENNLTGALDMGAVPDWLPGRRQVADPEERKAMADLWNVSVPDTPGLDIAGMIAAAESGKLKALFIMGENPIRSLPQPERVAAALSRLDFLVVQDIVYHRTAAMADVVLPAAAFAEKNGSFTNMEGRIQTFSPAVEPKGNALPDWAILGMLARKMGYPEQYTTIEKIRQEIRRVAPMYNSLGNHRCEWVTAGTKTPFTDTSLRFAFAPAAPPTAPSDDTGIGKTHYPYTATISNQRWHLGSGTRTSRSHRITSSDHSGDLELSEDVFETIIPGANGRIRLVSATGAIERTYRVNPGLAAGQIVVPLGFSDNDAMAIADFGSFEQSASEWRTCRVRIETI